jgi:hypothetical protein
MPFGNKEKAKEKASKALNKKPVIKSGIHGYIEFWEKGMAKCEELRRLSTLCRVLADIARGT